MEAVMDLAYKGRKQMEAASVAVIDNVDNEGGEEFSAF